MKKILLLAAMFGLAATLSTKGAEAKENWTTLCAKCHGADGKSDTKIGAKLGAKNFTDWPVAGCTNSISPACKKTRDELVPP